MNINCENYSFESFSNKQLYQTIWLPIFNTNVEIPFFHPLVQWNANTYNWAYFPIKQKWIVEECCGNGRFLKQYDAYGRLTWFSKQTIVSITSDSIIVNEYDMLNNEKLMGIVKYTTFV